MSNDEMSPAAKAIWTILIVAIMVVVSVSLAAWLLDTGLDAASVYGVPEASFGRCVSFVLGLVSIGWSLALGAASWRGKQAAPEKPEITVYKVASKEGVSG